jgi:glutamate mutase epsilon subunit
MADLDTLIEQTIARHVGPEARVVAVRERAGGAQGYSGATLHYYNVTYALLMTAPPMLPC